MSHPLNLIIDRALNRAQKNGELDNLPGAGKPIENLHAPKDATLHRLMSESRVKPPAVVLTERIAASQARLKGLTDEQDRKAEMKVLADLQTRYAIEMEAWKRFG